MGREVRIVFILEEKGADIDLEARETFPEDKNVLVSVLPNGSKIPSAAGNLMCHLKFSSSHTKKKEKETVTFLLVIYSKY